MAEAETPLRTPETPCEFERLYAAWQYAKGRWQMLSYAPDTYVHGLPDEEEDELCNAAFNALNAFLLHPVTCPKQFARKMRVFRDEEIFNLWSKGPEIVEQFCRDTGAIAYPELRERAG